MNGFLYDLALLIWYVYTMMNLNSLKFKFVLVDHMMLCVPLFIFIYHSSQALSTPLLHSFTFSLLPTQIWQVFIPTMT